jgi:hypothetical protein
LPSGKGFRPGKQSPAQRCWEDEIVSVHGGGRIAEVAELSFHTDERAPLGLVSKRRTPSVCNLLNKMGVRPLVRFANAGVGSQLFSFSSGNEHRSVNGQVTLPGLSHPPRKMVADPLIAD